MATHKNKFGGEQYNIGTGKSISVNEIVDLLGGEKSYGTTVIEPFETLSCTAKIDLDLDWKSKRSFSDWISEYKENLGL